MTAGIEKIKIPCLLEDMNVSTVERYLPYVIKKHDYNADKITKLKEYIDGTGQEEYLKNYLRDSDGNISNVVMNHAAAIVNFKQGFLLGDKRQYAPKENAKGVSEINYIERFDTDVSFLSKDLEIKYNAYGCGVGVSFVAPRTDIISAIGENAAVFETDRSVYDSDNESPFLYESLDPAANGIVYSNCVGEHKGKDLFDFNKRIVSYANGRKRKIYTVWTRDWVAEFDASGKYIQNTLIETSPKYRELPMVEHSINASRIGVVERVQPLLNAINVISTGCVKNLDDIRDFILVFTNCDIDGDALREMRKERAIKITSGVNAADVKKIDVAMDFQNINVFFEQLLTRTYDIAGVPLASASVGNGNNGAAYIGGGWTNAHTVIKRDILAFEESDRELLKKKIKICKLNPNNPIKELSANSLELKYNPAMNDNLQEKTQAIVSLSTVGLDRVDILKASGLFNNVETVAKNWEKRERENQKIMKKETKNDGIYNNVTKEVIATKQIEQ